MHPVQMTLMQCKYKALAVSINVIVSIELATFSVRWHLSTALRRNRLVIKISREVCGKDEGNSNDNSRTSEESAKLKVSKPKMLLKEIKG